MLFSTLLFSCQKNASFNNQSSETLDLISPNNTIIATNKSDLKNSITTTINKKFNEKTSFKIESINFLNVQVGAVANIQYKTIKGVRSNVVFIVDFPINKIIGKFNNSNIFLKTNKSSVSVYPITISCSGGDCCKVHVHINDDGSLFADCSCNPCTQTIE